MLGRNMLGDQGCIGGAVDEGPVHPEQRDGVLCVWDPVSGRICAEVSAQQVAFIRVLETNGLRVTRTRPPPAHFLEDPPEFRQGLTSRPEAAPWANGIGLTSARCPAGRPEDGGQGGSAAA